jgi:GxxExxY protein
MSTDVETINRITERIIGCAFKVGSKLGCGYLEKCYKNALAHELRKAGLVVERDVELKVWYDDIIVGEYIADLIVEGCVLIELKSCDSLHPAHTAQCINYLAATRLPPDQLWQARGCEADRRPHVRQLSIFICVHLCPICG